MVAKSLHRKYLLHLYQDEIANSHLKLSILIKLQKSQVSHISNNCQQILTDRYTCKQQFYNELNCLAVNGTDPWSHICWHWSMVPHLLALINGPTSVGTDQWSHICWHWSMVPHLLALINGPTSVGTDPWSHICWHWSMVPHLLALIHGPTSVGTLKCLIAGAVGNKKLISGERGSRKNILKSKIILLWSTLCP